MMPARVTARIHGAAQLPRTSVITPGFTVFARRNRVGESADEAPREPHEPRPQEGDD